MHPTNNLAISATGFPPSRERFLILARELGAPTEGLSQLLAPLGKVEIIVDRPTGGGDAVGAGPKQPAGGQAASPAVIFISNEEAEGYGGLMSHLFPFVTAWSRAFAHLDRTLTPGEAVWLVEDDVAADRDSITELVRKTAGRNADLSAIDLRAKREDPLWPWWGYAEDYFRAPCRAFQPLCRLSEKLIRRALDFRDHVGRFTFHEVLFASLAHESKMPGLDWKSDPGFQHLVAAFTHSPAVSHPIAGVSHPVKDPRLHAEICKLVPSGHPQGPLIASR